MAETDKSREFEVKLTNVRLSFAHIFRPQEGRQQDDGTMSAPKYNCSFLIPKDTPEGKENAKRLAAALRACGDAKWGANPDPALVKAGKAKAKWSLKPEKKCLRDGDQETFDGYAGMFYCSASNTRKPKLLDRKKNPVSESDDLLYSGCYVNGVVRVWAQDNKHGKRLNASLEGIQFVRHGEAFGAAPLDDDAFDALDDDGDDVSGDNGGDEDDGFLD